jgi:hypothetical protein
VATTSGSSSPRRAPKRFGVGLVGGDLLLDDRLGQLPLVQRAVAVGVGRDLGAVDRDHTDGRKARVGAQPQDFAEQLAQRALVTDDETRDRRVVRPLLGGDDPAGQSSRQARSIRRADRAPRDQQYNNNAIIIDGS